MIKTYVKGKVVKLSANFKSTEFDCKGKGCCSETLIDEKLVGYLQNIRDHFGAAVNINSGYRCEIHNAKEGGAKKSNHKKGMAADIRITGIKPEEVAKYCESIGILGIGLYSWGCHIDTRTKKAFWKTDKQIYVPTFGGVTPIKEWQLAAISDGFKFPKSGADGIWGAECEAVAKKAVVKKQIIGYKYPALTKIVQRTVGVTEDGKCGKNTAEAIKKWQKQNGLVADGAFGVECWRKLLK